MGFRRRPGGLLRDRAAASAWAAVLPIGDARFAIEHAAMAMRNQPGRRPWTVREIQKRVDRAFAQAAHAPRTLEAR
jgi:hypothetical protein